MEEKNKLTRNQEILIDNIPIAAAQEFIDTKAAARILGMSADWLAHARIRGEGPPFVRFGGSIRYSVNKLREWGAAQVEER